MLSFLREIVLIDYGSKRGLRKFSRLNYGQVKILRRLRTK